MKRNSDSESSAAKKLKESNTDHHQLILHDFDHTDNNNPINNNNSSSLQELLTVKLGGKKIQVVNLDFQPIKTINGLLDLDGNQNRISYISSSIEKNVILYKDSNGNSKYIKDGTFYNFGNIPSCKSYNIDSQFENIFITFNNRIAKYKILHDDIISKISESPIWEIKFENIHFADCYCQSKNEIYINCIEKKHTIIVYDSETGLQKREISLPTLLEYEFTFLKLYYDSINDSFYIISSNRDENQTLYTVLYDLSNGTLIKRVNFFGDFIFKENYNIYCDMEGFIIYEKKTNNLLLAFKNNISSHYIISNNLFYSLNYFHKKIEIFNPAASTDIENIPIVKESYYYLSELGIELPSIIGLSNIYNDKSERMKCCEFLLNIKLESNSQLLHFGDNDKISRFTFIESNEDLFIDNEYYIGSLNDLDNIDNQLDIYIEQSTLNNYDFVVHIKNNDVVTKTTFSQLISKLKVYNTIELNPSLYFVNFELIYEQLVQNSMINPQNRNKIDSDLLLEKHKKMMYGRNQEDYFELVKKLNDSTIRINNMTFQKMDLIVLAEKDCVGLLKISQGDDDSE